MLAIYRSLRSVNSQPTIVLQVRAAYTNTANRSAVDPTYKSHESDLSLSVGGPCHYRTAKRDPDQEMQRKIHHACKLLIKPTAFVHVLREIQELFRSGRGAGYMYLSSHFVTT
jgi:hypothetical protein